MTGRGKSSGRQKRLKMEIMGLGPAERSRIKSFKGIHELDQVCAIWVRDANFKSEKKLYPTIPGAILESRKAKGPPRLPKDKNFQQTNAIQMDIIKGYNVPLASETLELPSTEDILDRARGMAYEYQLTHAVGPNVPELVYAGLEVFPSKSFLTIESSQKSYHANHYSRSCQSTEYNSNYITARWKTGHFRTTSNRSRAHIYNTRRVGIGLGSKPIYARWRDPTSLTTMEQLRTRWRNGRRATTTSTRTACTRAIEGGSIGIWIAGLATE